MANPILAEVLRRAETWPKEAQLELAAVAADIDAGVHGEFCHASDEELAAIEKGLEDARAGRFASPDEIDALLGRHRRG